MKTLLDILGSIDEIIVRAKEMGFVNVRMYDPRPNGEGCLYLLVSVDSTNAAASSGNDFLLDYVLPNV